MYKLFNSQMKQGSAFSQQALSNLNNTIKQWTNSWKNCLIVLSNPVLMNTNEDFMQHILSSFQQSYCSFDWTVFSVLHACLVTYGSITLFIQGAGTAIGELPPYFMARAGNKWQCPMQCMPEKYLTQCDMRNVWLPNFSLVQSFRAKFSADPLSHGSALWWQTLIYKKLV